SQHQQTWRLGSRSRFSPLSPRPQKSLPRPWCAASTSGALSQRFSTAVPPSPPSPSPSPPSQSDPEKGAAAPQPDMPDDNPFPDDDEFSREFADINQELDKNLELELRWFPPHPNP